jgi:hypothetical protein
VFTSMHPGTRPVAGGRASTTCYRRIQHFSPTMALQLFIAVLPALVTVALVTCLCTVVITTLQPLATH